MYSKDKRSLKERITDDFEPEQLVLLRTSGTNIRRRIFVIRRAIVLAKEVERMEINNDDVEFLTSRI